MFENQQELVLSMLHKFADDSDSDVKRFAGMIREEDKLERHKSKPEEESMNVDQMELPVTPEPLGLPKPWIRPRWSWRAMEVMAYTLKELFNQHTTETLN